MTKREVYLEGGAPWGFRMNGGADSGHPLRISRVNPGSKAAQQGVREGDVISAINGTPTRLLSNGESHALLRSAGPTLTLGLNQDCTGSPKRRNRESNRRGETGSGTQETKSPSDSVTHAQVKTVVDIACTSSSQPNKQGKKTKQRRQENKEDEQINSKESISGCEDNPVSEKDENVQTEESHTCQKMSSSKARRLRKARLKNKIKENTVNDSLCEINDLKDVLSCSVVSTARNADTSLISNFNPNENVDVPSSGSIVSSQPNNIATLEIDLKSEEKSFNKKSKKEKQKNKSEGKSNDVQTSCGKSSNKLNCPNSRNQYKNNKNSNSIEDIKAQSSINSEKSDTTEVKTNESTNLENETNVSRELQSDTISISNITNNLSKSVTHVKNVNSKTKEDMPPCIKETVRIIDSSLININNTDEKPERKITQNCSKNTTICRQSGISNYCKKEIVKIIDNSKFDDKISTEKNDEKERQDSFKKEVVNMMDNRTVCDISSTVTETKSMENKVVSPCEKESDHIADSKLVSTNYLEMTLVEGVQEVCDSSSSGENTTTKPLILRLDEPGEEICERDPNNIHLNSSISDSSCIEVVINPPTPTMGVENTFFGPNWEIIEELETSSGPASSDEDVHQEYFVHFPPNDLRAQVASPLLVDDGNDDYGLTVQDVRNPIIPPEEEAKLRSFLETLDLTKPEEYDDSSSNKSSEEALVSSEPDCYATKQEIVVYKHCKRRSVAEPCYIPSPHRHYLDVITEENSDLSDCDRKNEERPWESSDIIRKNNEFDSIPDDWMDSDNDTEYGYEDGGIKSWSEGTTLDEAEGVEIIYLDSDNSDDVVFKEQELNEKPQLVVVQTKEINKVLSVDACEKNSLSSFESPKLPSETSYNEISTAENTTGKNKDNVAIKIRTENSQFQFGDNHYAKVADDSQNRMIQSQSENVGSCTANIREDNTVQSAVNEDKTINFQNHQEGNNASQTALSTNRTSMEITENNCNENKYEKATELNNARIEEQNSCKNDHDSRHTVNDSLQSLDLIKNDSNYYFNFDDEIKEVSEFESLFKSLTSKSAKSVTNVNEDPLIDHKTRRTLHGIIEQKCPLPEEKLDVSVTPTLSRQNSSGSGTPTTQSTTRCTTSQSPTFYEKEDIITKPMSNFCSEVELKTPDSLKELSAKKVISLPNGVRLLEEVGIIRFSSENSVFDRNYSYYKDKNSSPRNISRRSSTLPESPAETHPTSRPLSLGSSSLPNDIFSPRSSSVLMFTPPYSPPYSVNLGNEEPWLSLQTSEENLRVCLSPSQCKSRTLPASPREAAGLLDLHKKFIQRRGYHEDKRRYSNDNLPSPDLIQLEHCNEMRKPQDYTPELLTEAANLLALKEYRRSRFAENFSEENCQKRSHSLNETIDELSIINCAEMKETSENDYNEGQCEKKEKNNKLKKKINCSAQKEKESKRKGKVFDSNFTCETPASYEIFSDAKGGALEVEESSKREELGRVLEPSDGSRLLALIQSQIYPAAKAHCPIATTALCNPLFDRTGEEIGTKFTGSGDFVSGWLTMSRNVTQSEGERVFDAEQYRISKQGDIAVMLSPDSKRPDRPKSLPPNVSSGGEIFRKKMYDEYMDKVAERYERRQQKVIKISDRPSSMFISKEELKDVTLSFDAPKLEDEFMNKVKERMNKLGISLEDDDADNASKEESQLPKHLQEFVQLTSESPKNGVWSPVQTPEAQRKTFDFESAQKEREKEEEEKKKGEDDQSPVVWTPRSAPSPPVEKKSFRPINFESPPPVRKSYQPVVNEEILKPPTSLPITPSDWTHKDKSEKTIISESIDTHRRLTSSQSAESSLAASTETTLPRAPNPTITLLQKAREGQLPRGAHYLDEETERSSIEKREERRLVEPNEIIYTVRREYSSESEDKKPKKIVELGPRKFEGIGPTTKEGIPIVLRSEVKDANQQKWYKRMYDSLHRAEQDRDLITVRYKPNRRGYPYSLGGGYLSEPDRLGTDYDSDAVSSKYATLDRRRIRNKENDFTTSTMPRSKYASGSVKHAVDVYKNQPGRIEDYEPGRSSISEKEAKQWWDEVLDIFDEQFEQSQKTSKPPPTTPNTGKPFMTYALKESGYESDSQLVFKRRDENLQNQLAMSPAEQKMAYKVIQKGGEVPLHGLRKPAPERPKEPISGGAIPVPERDFHSKQQRPESPHRYVESEVTIHYRSPVRSEAKEAWSEEELARRQAEAMRRIYQEERRRKYLQELQDMYSRRHTDNFIPSQKSPIPLNRYDDFLDDVSPTKPRDHTPEPKLVARALYNFVGQSSRELTFRRGDVIFVRRQIDKNWYEGEHNAMIGLFPINYVEIIPYDGIRTTPKRPSEGQARAKFNFQAQTHLELSLVKGELIVLTRRVDDNWFEGRIGSRKGIFPVSYVEVLVEPGDRTVSPVRPTTPASNKPVASPAAHSLMLNGSKNSLSHHHYTPPPPVSYTSLSRSSKTIKSDLAPVNQALHIDTQSEPVPYRALYNYKPQNDDELELNEGDTVYVMEKCDDGWYVGSSQRTGCFGTFPGNYVQRLSRGH